MCEQAGVPSVSLTCEGFQTQFVASSLGLRVPGVASALVPSRPDLQTDAELRENIFKVTTDAVVAGLTTSSAAAAAAHEPHPREPYFSGSFEAVNRRFIKERLSDGLPVVPPTRERIEEFLAWTQRSPDEILGTPLPDQREATIWSIAVNGVMAGCRPEYMPILVALVEAMVDPNYGVEHSGNTPGSETLIIVNGPIIKDLGFNYLQGALRDGFQPNTAIGRFWRLFQQNVAGFHLHQTDKGTFGNTWRVVLAENEDVLSEIGWPPNSVEMGHQAGDNTVTIARYTGGNVLVSVAGSTPEELLPYVAEQIERMVSWHIMFTVGARHGSLRPLLILSPILARTIAKAGCSKDDVKTYLWEHARKPAWEVERQRARDHLTQWDLAEAVKKGIVPKVFHESDDPNRMVPIVCKREDFMIAVSGDLMRNNCYVFAHNGNLGYPTGKRIELPVDWKQRLAALPD